MSDTPDLLPRRDALLGLVGFNPASVAVAFRTLRPHRAVLAHTTETAEVARVLQGQLGPDRVALVRWRASAGVEEVAGRAARDLAPRPGETVWLDITGANKLASLGAWQGLTQKLGESFRAVYLDQRSYGLHDARTGVPLTLDGRPAPEVRIETAEVLAWHGARAAGAKWEGALDRLPAGYAGRAAVGRALLAALQEGALPELSGEGLPAGALRLPSPLPRGLHLREGLLTAAEPDYLGKNAWLEELCLVAAAEAASGCPGICAALGLRVTGGAAGKDEMDVVLTRGPRVVVVEAKASRNPQDAGGGVQKRVQKARRFFGAHVRVVFVHPSWGERAPRGLSDVMGDNAALVGGSEPRLRRELRKALGLED